MVKVFFVYRYEKDTFFEVKMLKIFLKSTLTYDKHEKVQKSGAASEK